MIALDKGENRFEFIRLKKDAFQKYELFKPIPVNNLNLIKTTNKRPKSSGNSISLAFGKTSSIDTLTFYIDILVKYNHTPKDEYIKSIKVISTICFGKCTEYTLEVFDNYSAQFNGIRNTPILGEQRLTMSKEEFKELSDLLNYIDIKSLKSNYTVSWSDDQTIYLDVVFKDGS